jgi:hypothetical protein
MDGVTAVLERLHPILIEAKLAPYAGEVSDLPEPEPRPLAVAQSA